MVGGWIGGFATTQHRGKLGRRGLRPSHPELDFAKDINL